MPDIFTYTDDDGDRMTVEGLSDGDVFVENIDRSDGERATVALGAEQVTALRAALKPYDPSEQKQTEGMPMPELELVVGREYRLLPVATYGNGHRSLLNSERTTRVRLDNATPDHQGDVRVTPLDGQAVEEGGALWRYVNARCLAPLEVPAPRQGATPAFTILDEAHTWRDADAPELLDPVRVAAVEKALELLGGDGAAVDTDTMMVVADFLAEVDAR